MQISSINFSTNFGIQFKPRFKRAVDKQVEVYNRVCNFDDDIHLDGSLYSQYKTSLEKWNPKDKLDINRSGSIILISGKQTNEMGNITSDGRVDYNTLKYIYDFVCNK